MPSGSFETALICAPQPVPLRELRVLFNDALGSDTLKMLLQDLQRDWSQRAWNWCRWLPVGAFRAVLKCVNTWIDSILRSLPGTLGRLSKPWPSLLIGSP